MIARGESGAAAYRAYTPGPNFKTGQARAFEDITLLTVGKILDFQKRGELGAVGKYQIIYSTLAMAVSAGVLGAQRMAGRVQFNKATQDKLYKLSLIHI